MSCEENLPISISLIRAYMYVMAMRQQSKARIECLSLSVLNKIGWEWSEVLIVGTALVDEEVDAMMLADTAN